MDEESTLGKRIVKEPTKVGSIRKPKRLRSAAQRIKIKRKKCQKLTGPEKEKEEL